VQGLARQLRVIDRQPNFEGILETGENGQAVTLGRITRDHAEAIHLRNQRQCQGFAAGIDHPLARLVIAKTGVEKAQEAVGIRTIVCRTHLKLVAEQHQRVIFLTAMRTDHLHLHIRQHDAR